MKVNSLHYCIMFVLNRSLSNSLHIYYIRKKTLRFIVFFKNIVLCLNHSIENYVWVILEVIILLNILLMVIIIFFIICPAVEVSIFQSIVVEAFQPLLIFLSIYNCFVFTFSQFSQFLYFANVYLQFIVVFILPGVFGIILLVLDCVVDCLLLLCLFLLLRSVFQVVL